MIGGNISEGGPNFFQDLQSNYHRRSSYKSGRLSMLSKAERMAAASTRDTGQGTDSAAQRQDSAEFARLFNNINQLNFRNQDRLSLKSITSPSPRRGSRKSVAGGTSSAMGSSV